MIENAGYFLLAFVVLLKKVLSAGKEVLLWRAL